MQAFAHGNTGGFKGIAFFFEGTQAEDDAVADVALYACMQDAGGDEVQDGFFAVNDEGMAGVVAALVTHDGARFFGEQVDDFAFAFVAPLGADNDEFGAHVLVPRFVGMLRRGVAGWCA